MEGVTQDDLFESILGEQLRIFQLNKEFCQENILGEEIVCVRLGGKKKHGRFQGLKSLYLERWL